MFRNVARLVLAFLAIASAAPPGDAASYTLAQVEELARSVSPAVAAARARIAHAEGSRDLGVAVPDPSITLGGARARPDAGGPSGSEWTVGAEVDLPSPWGSSARRRAGDGTVQAAAAESEVAGLDAIFQSRRLYLEAVIAEDRESAMREAASDAATLLALVTRRVQVGEAAEIDRLRAQVEARRAEVEARAARADVEGARGALDRFLQSSLGPDFELATRFDPVELPPTPPGATEASEAVSPELAAARARAEAAAARVSAEGRARFPGIRLGAFHVSEIDKTATGGTLTLGIPFWNRNEAAIRVAAAEQSEAGADLARLESARRASLVRLIPRDAAARERALAFAQEILPAARKTVAIAELALEQGESSLLPWLEARRTYVESLRAALDARLDAFLTRAELERLLGATRATPNR